MLGLLVGLVPAADAIAQIGGEQFVEEHLTIRDGLPVNHTNALLQGGDGYLWIATFGGLVRYDGLRFRTFSAGNSPDIPSDRITMVFPGPGTKFWFLTEGLELVGVSPGRFDPVARFTAPVLTVYPDADSVTWIGTGNGLFRLTEGTDPGGQILTRIEAPELAGVSVRRVLRDGNGVLWFTSADDHRIFFNASGEWQSIEGPDRVELDNRFLYEDHRGRLWTGGVALHRVRPGGVEPTTVTGLPVGEPGFRVVDVSEGLSGELLLFTSYGPYVVRNDRAQSWLGFSTPQHDNSRNNLTAFAQCPDGRLWTHFRGVLYSDDRRVAPISEHIAQLVCDSESNLWVTGESGLHRFRPARVQTYGQAEGLSVERPTSAFQDDAGGILITGLTSEYDRLYGSQVTSGLVPLGGGPFYQDRRGNLWSGTTRCRVEDIEADGNCTQFEDTRGPLGRPQVRATHEDRFGTMWFGLQGGLTWLRNGQWYMLPRDEPFSGTTVRYFLEAREGTLYMATNGAGIAVHVPGSEGEESFGVISMDDGLSSNHVRGLFEDHDGAIWIATEDRGLNRFDPSTGEIVVVRKSDGLYSDGLHQVLEDGYGRIWMSSNQGIFWVRADELRSLAAGQIDRITSIYYQERDGMRIREANGGFQGSALKARDGRLWFATQGGVAVIDPSLVDQDLAFPVVVIEDLEAGDAQKSLAGLDAVRLAPAQRTFRIGYTAINFTAPQRMRFRYFLEGYDEQIVDAGNRREATYTKVPAGTYELQVWGSNGDGVWSEEPSRIAITVDPYLYERAPFQVAAVLLVLGLAWLAWTSRTRVLVGRQQALRRAVAERTEALRQEKQRTEEQARQLVRLDQAKTRFFTNISHEFRTPLTLTIGPLEDARAVNDMPEEARGHVDLALTNSRRILRLINQLLDVARLEAGEMKLVTRHQDLAGFVAGVARQFVPLIERKQLHLDIDVPETPIPAYFDPEKMEQILVNLISNAIKFTPEGGALYVGVRQEEASIKLVVRDTGAGIPPEVLPHVFDRFYGRSDAQMSPHGSSGIGLSLVQDLVELHQGSVSVDSILRFGSTFTVKLPLGRDHLADDQIAADAEPTAPRRYLLEIASLDAEASVSATVEPDDRFTVLVADDSADIRRYVRSQLSARYQVLEAADGKEALELVQRATPDLVISDIMMPVMDGLALLAALRADTETDFIPVIMLTAKATEDDRLEALERGADAYLTKPFSVRELQVRIDALIESRQRLKNRLSQRGDGPTRPAPTPETVPGLSAGDAAFLARVNGVVAENLSEEDFDVRRMAEELRISRKTLHRRLKGMVDESPSEFLKRARLERAVSLLQEHEWNVSEVAYAVGFKSISYFSFCFRDAYGTTPSAYAAEAAAGGES